VVRQNIAGSEALFRAGQRDVLLQLSTDVFDATWLVGLALFGLHLVLLGGLVRRSADMPSALGIVLILAGVGYFTDTLAHALVAGYDDLAGVFLAIYAIPSFFGELWLTLWLLTRTPSQGAVTAL
jgi:hypothetical protein